MRLGAPVRICAGGTRQLVSLPRPVGRAELKEMDSSAASVWRANLLDSQAPTKLDRIKPGNLLPEPL